MKGKRLGRREAEELLSGRAPSAGAAAEDSALSSILAAARHPLESADPQRRRETVAAMAAAAWRAEDAPEATAAAVPARRRLARISTAGSRLALGTGVGTLALFGSLTTASALSGTVAAAVHHTLGITLPLAHATAPAPPPAPAPVAGPAARAATLGPARLPAAVEHPVLRPRHHPASGRMVVPPQPQPVFAGVVPGAGGQADADHDQGRADQGRADQGRADDGHAPQSAFDPDGRHGHHPEELDNPGQVQGPDQATATTSPNRDDHQVTAAPVKSDDSTPPTYTSGPDGRRDTDGHHHYGDDAPRYGDDTSPTSTSTTSTTSIPTPESRTDDHHTQPDGAASNYSGRKHPVSTHDRAPSSTRTSTTKPTTSTPSSTSSSTTSSTTVPAGKADWPTTGTTHTTDPQFNP